MSLADVFSALADQTRCRVVEMLREEPLPVHELAAAFAISRPAISRHLRVLKEAGLVTESRRGRENVYALQRARLKPAMAWLDRHGPAKRPAARAAHAGSKPMDPALRRVSSAGRDAPKARRGRGAPPAKAPPPQLSFFDM